MLFAPIAMLAITIAARITAQSGKPASRGSVRRAIGIGVVIVDTS
jgi:hypothetical protein